MSERHHAAAAYPPPPADSVTRPATPDALTAGECWDHLRRAPVGRMAYVVDGWPVIVPVNHVVDGVSLVLRSNPGGKLAAARRSAQVAIEVDEVDLLYRSGWSVLVLGVAEAIDDEREVRRLEAGPARSWATDDTATWIRVVPVSVTGRRLPRAWRYPASPS